MPELNVRGVPVHFPFIPYDSQRDFMSKVVEALQTNQNALLESPTGTGKTLCLLCASLAWLDTHESQQQLLRAQSLADTEQMRELEEQLKAGVSADQLPTGFSPTRVRVIYASRTHTQLSQVMGELKRTAYSRFRTAIMASRDQLCIHPTVSKETSNQAKQSSCRIKKQTRTCHYYNNVEKKKNLKVFHNPDDPESNILDIEDLTKLGNRHKCCPYFLTRDAAKEHAQIIFMPYNYLLDPVIRKRHGIELEGSIVIFDEAHNLNQVAEESASVEITAAEVTSALEEIDVVVTLLDEHGKELLEGDNFQSSAGDEGIDFQLLTQENVLRVKAVLLDIEMHVAAVDLGKDNELKCEGQYIYSLLEKAELKFDTFLAIYKVVDAVIGYLTGGGYSGIHAKAYGLGRFANFIKVVFDSDPYNRDRSIDYRREHVSQFYKVYIYDKEPAKFQTNKRTFWEASGSTTPKHKVRVVCFWCFSPGFSMIDLQKQGVRCVLLTSGTLKPLDSFSSELKIPFPIRLENPHVICPSQVSVSVVKQGPESVVLNSNYQNRSDPKYHTSLGYAIMQIAKAVPNGMLVFFPSYYIMKMIMETWNNGHIMQCIQRYKQVYVEPSNKEEFQQAMEQYYTTVNDHTANGAIFCGVCRGKVSEGLDFVDKNGRAVVITGIPYAPAKDAKVVMKKSYLDQQRRNSGAKHTLTGGQWYSQQASRAVNQAIGRVIRHRFDYGAILLLDTRFSNTNSKEELPSWVKSNLTIHETFSSVIRTLNKFFSTVPGMVASRRAEVESQTVPAEAPSGRPRIPLSLAGNQSGGGLSAKTIYSDDVIDKPDTSDDRLAQLPARKKIKMEMVCTELSNTDTTDALPSAPTASRPVDIPSHQTKHEEKVDGAARALYECRQLLSKERLVSVKRSMLKYHRSKDMADMKVCINILLEKETTHHVIQCFRELISSKQVSVFDELVSSLQTEFPNSQTNSVEEASNTPTASNSHSKSRYSATISLFADCKRKLSPSQIKSVKNALLSYKDKGTVEDLVSSIHHAGAEAATIIFSKLRGALRPEDQEAYDRLLSSSAERESDRSCSSDGDNSIPTRRCDSDTFAAENLSCHISTDTIGTKCDSDSATTTQDPYNIELTPSCSSAEYSREKSEIESVTTHVDTPERAPSPSVIPASDEESE